MSTNSNAANNGKTFGLGAQFSQTPVSHKTQQYIMTATKPLVPELVDFIDRYIATRGGSYQFAKWLSESLYANACKYHHNMVVYNWFDVSRSIFAWGLVRNMHTQGTVHGQWLKFIEEFGEYTVNVRKGKDVTDDLGDMLVVLHMLYLLYVPQRVRTSDSLHTAHIPLDILLNMPVTDDDTAIVEQAKAQQRICRAVECFCDSEDFDIFPTLFAAVCSLCRAHGISPVTAMTHSFQQIADRKGRMIDGKFIKEEDLIKMDTVKAPTQEIHTATVPVGTAGE